MKLTTKPTDLPRFEIKDRYTETVLVAGNAETFAKFIEQAVEDHATLYGANLARANLYGANLYGATLYGAKLNNERTAVAAMQIAPLGSRRAELIAWVCDDQSILIWTGCFRDSLDKFQDAVMKTHGENIFGREYQAAIQFVLTWSALVPALAKTR